jgi:hypothetical protein
MTETERLRLESIAARRRAANPPDPSPPSQNSHNPQNRPRVVDSEDCENSERPGRESRRKLPPHFAGAAEVLDYLSASRAVDDAQADLRRLLEPAVVLDELLTGPRRHCNRQEFGETDRQQCYRAVADWPAREDLAPAVARLLDARAALLAAWDAVPDGLRAGLRGPGRLG